MVINLITFDRERKNRTFVSNRPSENFNSFLFFFFQTQVTIFFLGILVTGVLGNVLICVVIIRNSVMHTATNYYLFSLAVSDLLFLILGKLLYINGFMKFNTLQSSNFRFVTKKIFDIFVVFDGKLFSGLIDEFILFLISKIS